MKKLIIIAILLLPAWAFAATHNVSSDAEMDTAIAALGTGDTINLTGSFTQAGAEYEITDENVTIEGNDYTITLGADITYLIEIRAAGSTIQNLKLLGDKGNRSTGTGICLANGSNDHTIDSCDIQNFPDYGIVCSANADSQTIQDTTIKYCDNYLIWFNSSDSGTVSGCTLVGDADGDCGIYAQQSLNGKVTTSTFTDIAKVPIKINEGCTGWIVGANTITDWALAAASDAIRMDSNVHAYGNTITQTTDTAYLAWAFECAGTSGAADGAIIENNVIGGANLDRVFDVGDHDVLFRYNKSTVPNPTGSTVAVVRCLNCGGAQFYRNLWDVGIGSGEYGYYNNSNAVGSRTLTVYNETLYNSENDGTGYRFEENSGTWGTINFKNVITKGFAKGVVVEDKDDDGVGITHTHNLYHGNTKNLQKDVATVFSDISLDGTELTDDPLLHANFYIDQNSPAYNAGTDVGLHCGTTDIGWDDPECRLTAVGITIGALTP